MEKVKNEGEREGEKEEDEANKLGEDLVISCYFVSVVWLTRWLLVKRKVFAEAP